MAASDTEAVGERRSPVIGIVGLGQLGQSIGLALQEVKTDFRVWGHDLDHDLAREAGSAGAVDKTSWNLIDVAGEADLLFVTEPLSQLEATFEAIAPHLRPESLVTDTAGTKVGVMEMAGRLLPDGVSFVGGHPIPGPAAGEGQPESADARLLVGATYCLVPDPDASEAAVDVLAGLVTAIGARPYFIGADEHDALVAGVSHLPLVVDAAVSTMVGASPSARDLRRLSPGGLLVGSVGAAPPGGDRESTASLAGNAANVLPWLDQLLDLLGQYRAAMVEGDSGALTELLDRAEAARAEWLAGDDAGDDAGAEAVEELRDVNPLRNLIFGRGSRRPKD
ncbi:MAG: prephenate dehydrogenase [Anaerolineae bacterium]